MGSTRKGCAKADFAKIIKQRDVQLFRFSHTKKKKWAAIEEEADQYGR